MRAMLLTLVLAGTSLHAAADLLRVCADPNSLPYSNEAEEGFENALAAMLAEALGRELRYVWWPQRRGFVRNTLDADRCDLVIGVPAGYELAATSSAYYRSTYVMVTRTGDALDISGLDDPQLRALRIGVHTVGDDYGNPPPVQLLAAYGIREQVRGYSIYGDYDEPNPPARLIEALAKDEIDVAIVWGPIGGYFARESAVPLVVTPLEERYALPLSFAMAVGLRRGNESLLAEVEEVLDERRREIRALLSRYAVPLAEGDTAFTSGHSRRTEQ